MKPELPHTQTRLIDFCCHIATRRIPSDSEKWVEIPITQAERESLAVKLRLLRIDFSRAIIIHPSVSSPIRTWPMENWNQLTAKLRAAGHMVIAIGASNVMTKHKAKEGEFYAMQNCPDGAINLIDKLTLQETIALLERCLAIIALDTGPLHLAFSTDIYIVGMYTEVPPRLRMAWRKDGFEHKFIAVNLRVHADIVRSMDRVSCRIARTAWSQVRPPACPAWQIRLQHCRFFSRERIENTMRKRSGSSKSLYG